jgi:hypothetical protein
MFNGDPDHAFAHPEFYGDDKSCSHFPVSNIVAQGKNVGEFGRIVMTKERLTFFGG